MNETSSQVDTSEQDPLGSPRTATDWRAVLDCGGPFAVLRVLNARARFRFTGLYHADPPLLRNLSLFDRENPTLNVSGAVCPLDETYCSIVVAAERTFGTRDAAHDQRLALHPARDTVISYVGVPLRRANGVLWGTLCHFDVRPRLVPVSELPVLQSAAAALARWLDTMPPIA